MEKLPSNQLGFIKLIRNPKTFNLLKIRSTAFILLVIIALRAKRTNTETYTGLKTGEAYIGDYETYGATEQTYRTDKKFLEKYNLATFLPTSKGTIAQLANNDIFDINEEIVTNTLTEEKQSESEQLTTNNNDNNDKNVNSRLEKLQTYKNKYPITNPKTFLPTTEGEIAALEAWNKLEPYNSFAFQTTYLWAYRKGLPPALFYQFTSEIQQDPSIKIKGAIFRKKVEDYLNKKEPKNIT